MSPRRNPTRQGEQGPERHCSSCEQWKPETLDHFFMRSKERMDGSIYRWFYSICRGCQSRINRERVAAIAAERAALDLFDAGAPDATCPAVPRPPADPLIEVPACEALRSRFGF